MKNMHTLAQVGSETGWDFRIVKGGGKKSSDSKKSLLGVRRARATVKPNCTLTVS